jgi:hypothetical protein
MKPKNASSANRKPSARPKPAKKARPSPLVGIDFPQEREMVIPGDYSVRVSADPAAEVELSFDGGEWLKCRQAAGFHWYDWRPEATGSHKLVARVRSGEGLWSPSSERICIVVENQ